MCINLQVDMRVVAVFEEPRADAVPSVKMYKLCSARRVRRGKEPGGAEVIGEGARRG